MIVKSFLLFFVQNSIFYGKISMILTFFERIFDIKKGNQGVSYNNYK